ncbi:hypothetical protein ASC74_13615 [Pseudomonas sp. Root329]|uniref:hypothetical protein n=1 Tax=Pseudomonas sp. Root329 TaxID=1736515 RepID=UPI0006FD5BDF|nr:hypothetical protein [Pseudomonas sp. Root329]KQV10064.1 hypothetical protein ASC74_13615 [Pseudomonas sp. Root329]
MDLNTDALVTLLSGLVGALIGGAFTLRGATKAHELALKKEAAADKEKMVTTLMLLRTEIATGWKIFKDEYVGELSQQTPDTPYLVIFPIGESPFAIFNSAPQALALLPQKLAKDIVHFYIRAKGVVAMIEMNNRDYEQALQYGRSVLANHVESARAQNTKMPEELKEQVFLEGVQFMAGQLGMSDTADGIRELGQELEPVVQRITAAVDELLVPVSGLHNRVASPML